MKLVDIHTHKISREEGVISIKNIPFAEFHRISSEKKGFYSAGIHPWDVENISNDSLERLKKLAAHHSIKLIGECGLDKNIPATFEHQVLLFRRQILLSEEVKKPLIIHCVAYFNELFQLKKELKPTQRWIIHGFRGKPQLAEQALKNGLDISFGDKFNPETVLITPLENLFIETDESALPVSEIYKSVSAIKQCDETELNAGYQLICPFF